MARRHQIWGGALMGLLGLSLAFLLMMHGALYVPGCQPGGARWSSTVPACPLIVQRIWAAWLLTGVGLVLMVWGVIRRPSSPSR